MKKSELLWILFPVGVLVFHFTWGATLRNSGFSSSEEALGYAAEANGNFEKAARIYAKARQMVDPDDFKLRARLEIAIARAATRIGDAPNAADQMERLLAGRAASTLAKAMRVEAMTVQATALYYTAYALRLFDSDPARWSVKAQEARAVFLSLHQNALKQDPLEVQARFARALEASTKLLHYRDAEFADLARPAIAQATLKRNAPARETDSTDETP
ncbi:MAG: hypothetical protein EBS01_06235 [Verrucomicrobia bacterium]|nr:hypothetical protein [Verrucomicrobiota bacterium]